MVNAKWTHKAPILMFNLASHDRVEGVCQPPITTSLFITFNWFLLQLILWESGEPPFTNYAAPTNWWLLTSITIIQFVRLLDLAMCLPSSPNPAQQPHNPGKALRSALIGQKGFSPDHTSLKWIWNTFINVELNTMARILIDCCSL